MSEPVSNAAIEDVLASIRRLVSDDTRQDEAAEQPAEADKPSKLVLTPSFRVAQPDGDKVEEEQSAENAGDNGGPVQDQDLSEDDQASAGDEVVPDSAHVNDGVLHVENGDTVEDDEPWRDPDTTLFQAAKVEILTNPVHVPEPDLSEVQVVEPQVSPVEDLVVEHDEPETATGEDETPLSERIEALEAVIAQTEDQWEPDGDVGDAYAGTQTETLVWQDHVERTVEDVADDPATEASETDESLDVLSSDETYLDEESLRELVADIVRQELQGALGERITRNVRKLVRREIHRALVAQDLD
ncbi:MAG: hypothetical protein GJ676_16725 [Rhodobacteraceae bacterium]|nr:hypothetical protein [Paracoccaceae bacterium]